MCKSASSSRHRPRLTRRSATSGSVVGIGSYPISPITAAKPSNCPGSSSRMQGVSAILGAAISTVFVEMPVKMPLTWHLGFHNHPQHAVRPDSNRGESFQVLETPYLVKNQLLTALLRFTSSLPLCFSLQISSARHLRTPQNALTSRTSSQFGAGMAPAFPPWHKQTAARVCGIGASKLARNQKLHRETFHVGI